MPILLSSKPGPVKFNIGAVLIGSYINALLYGIAMLCVYIYKRSEHSRRDSLLVRLAVAACAVLDTAGTFGVCGNILYLSVAHWGSYSTEFRTHWTAVLWFLCTAWSQIIVQVFMVRRYFIMSRQYVISVIIILLMIFSLERNMYLGISSAIGALPAESRIAQYRPAILALGSSVAANFSTMTAMFWKLKATNTYSRITHNLIRRMSAVVIITGTATCIVSIATMISYLTYPLSTLSTAFACTAGRVYSLTMLFTLLYRDMIKDDQWIQIDDSARRSDVVSAESMTSGSIPGPGASTPVSAMAFASPPNLSRSASSQGHVVRSQKEASESGSSIRQMRREKVG